MKPWLEATGIFIAIVAAVSGFAYLIGHFPGVALGLVTAAVSFALIAFIRQYR